MIEVSCIVIAYGRWQYKGADVTHGWKPCLHCRVHMLGIPTAKILFATSFLSCPGAHFKFVYFTDHMKLLSA
jgi:hypothetical protein